jgi:hypothetical protein
MPAGGGEPVSVIRTVDESRYPWGFTLGSERIFFTMFEWEWSDIWVMDLQW